MENTYNIQNMLDYREIAEMRQDPKYRYAVLSEEFRKLTNQVVDRHITEDTTEVDVAYRFQFKLIDGMNVVGKITSIPIMDVVLRPGNIEPEPINQPRKYTIKERLKILLKGQL